jgi:hypothetical protein
MNDDRLFMYYVRDECCRGAEDLWSGSSLWLTELQRLGLADGLFSLHIVHLLEVPSYSLRLFYIGLHTTSKVIYRLLRF